MASKSTAEIHYEMARWELISRIEYRDNALIVFLGALASIFALISTGVVAVQFILVVPLLSYGAATIIENHNVIIGLIGHFLAVELEGFYRDKGISSPQWDTSISLLDNEQLGIHFPFYVRRENGHYLLMVSPAVISLIATWNYSVNTDTVLVLVWWLGLVFTLLAAVTIYRSSENRKRLYTRIRTHLGSISTKGNR